MDPRAYVIITPVRNEGRHLRQTIDSVVSQTLRPQKWVIVNDGSTDDTGKIIDAAAGRHPWIETVHRADRGFRKTGGGVIEAFNEGLRRVGGLSWEFIVKLDCDLVFGPDYFENLIGKFGADARLGIASGVYLEQRPKNGEWREIEMPAYHAAGACKVVRRECFGQIDGFIVDRGWDTVDEIKAMAKGWKTTHFRELQMKHLKPEGSGIGQWRTNVMLGEIYYLTGGSAVFFILKLAYRFLCRPVFVGGLAMLLGYSRMAARRQATLVSAEEARCYRALLLGRITSRARRLLQIG
jgi:glycosyltransferase involved in cell wall biosynthesis